MDIKTRVAPILRFLAHQKYELDVYQRGYVWTEGEIRKFLTDLEDHARDWLNQTAPPPWFLGTVLVEKRAGRNFLVDGQQRLVTLGLLLLALHPIATGARKAGIQLALKGGGRTLALPVAVGRYQLAFSALARGAELDRFTERDPDQRRIASAYFQIADWVNTSLKDRDHQMFIDSVLRLCLLNVVTVSDTHLAYRLFNSLNSRGKPLSVIETLKSVLLADVPEDEREELATAWDKARQEAFNGGNDPALNALRSALIARAAPAPESGEAFASSDEVRSIRENPFDWLAHERLDRPSSEQIARQLPFYVRLDGRFAKASEAPIPGAQSLHFATACGVPHEHWAPLVMAPLTSHDEPQDLNLRRAAAVIAFLEVAAARIAWRRLALSPAQIRDSLAGIAPLLRNSDPENLAYSLVALLEGHFPEDFTVHNALHVGGDGLPEGSAHAMLARMSEYVETYTSAPVGDYAHFASDHYRLISAPPIMPLETPGRKPTDPLQGKRNRLGTHVLVSRKLAKSIEAAIPKDRPEILAQADNRLALTAALNPPSDKRFEESVVALATVFPGHPLKSPADIGLRDQVYAELAQRIWSPDRILEAAADPHPQLPKALGLAHGQAGAPQS